MSVPFPGKEHRHTGAYGNKCKACRQADKCSVIPAREDQVLGGGVKADCAQFGGGTSGKSCGTWDTHGGVKARSAVSEDGSRAIATYLVLRLPILQKLRQKLIPQQLRQELAVGSCAEH